MSEGESKIEASATADPWPQAPTRKDPHTMSEHPHIVIIAIGNHVDLETGETTGAPTIAATVDR